jgi:hypothetical protein
VTSLHMAKEDRVHLAGVLSRAVRWDDATVVRLQSTAKAVGVFFEAPMNVLTFIALPLAQPLSEPLDRVVSAHRLRDCIGELAQAAPGVGAVDVPDARDTPASLAVTPSRDGWIVAEKATASEVSDAMEVALAEYDTQMSLLAQASEQARQDFLNEWWERPVWGGLPIKAVHVARSLGMLSHPGARVESATRGGWKRFVSPAGQVFVAPPQAYEGIPLTIVR